MLTLDKPQPEPSGWLRDSRCPRRHRRHWALCALLATATLASARSDDGPAVKVSATSSASITLDGLLNEPAWRDAPVMKLTQQAPKPGQPTPYETQVQVIVTSDRIYFGFTCKDPDPRHIAIHTMRRDGDLTGDDTVSIVLDTYGDRRTGYFFQINAAGTRVDGLISTADSVSLDWDGIWDARTARTPDGWSAEIVIPSRTLELHSRPQRLGTEPGAICSARTALAALVIADVGFISVRSKPCRPLDWSWRSQTGQRH